MAEVIDVSILLTSYKFRRYLRAAVDSLLAQQTQRRLEIIVIDDASPEHDAEVLADICDARLSVLRHPQNQGFAKSISAAFALCKGQYIARFDGDDLWVPDAIELLAAALDRCPVATVAFGDVQLMNGESELGEKMSVRAAGEAVRDEFENLLKQHFTCAPAMLFRRGLWEAAMPWPERFTSGLGDWYFNLKFARQAPFVYVPKLLAYYRVHMEGMHVHFLLSNVGERNLRAILDEFYPLADPLRLGLSRAQLLAHHLGPMAAGYVTNGKVSEARRLFLEVLRLDYKKLLVRPLFPLGFGVILLGRFYLIFKGFFRRKL